MPEQEYKRCSKCGETKPLDGFHRWKQAYDGRKTRCKVCRRAETRAWTKANPEKKVAQDRRYREENREKVRAADKRRYNERKAQVLERQRKYNAENRERRNHTRREWRRKNPGRVAASTEAQRKRHPEKARARRAITVAVAQGRLTKPDACEKCQAPADDPADLHGHHDDYSRPLDVRWLCRGCHAAAHRAGAAM